MLRAPKCSSIKTFEEDAITAKFAELYCSEAPGVNNVTLLRKLLLLLGASNAKKQRAVKGLFHYFRGIAKRKMQQAAQPALAT